MLNRAYYSLFAGATLLVTIQGCTVYVRPAPAPQPVVVEPVVSGPGVELVEVEPAPPDRVYVYDPGFPPGVYWYGGYYWYDGYRYPHDLFIHNYVERNRAEHRYFDQSENRRMSSRIEEEHRQRFAVDHGVRHRPPARRPEVRSGEDRRDRP